MQNKQSKELQKKQRNRKKKKLRIRKKIQGHSTRPRLTVYKSKKNLYVQLIDDEAGYTLCSASTLEKEFRRIELDQDKQTTKKPKKTNKKETYCTKEHAKKLGELLAKRAEEKKIQQLVFDRNGYQYHGQIQVLADQIREKGFRF